MPCKRLLFSPRFGLIHRNVGCAGEIVSDFLENKGWTEMLNKNKKRETDLRRSTSSLGLLGGSAV